jgi:hypothetical protein
MNEHTETTDGCDVILYRSVNFVKTQRQLIGGYNTISVSEFCEQQTISRIDGLVHEPSDRNILHVQKLVAVDVPGVRN